MIKTHTVWITKEQADDLATGKRTHVYAKKAKGRGRNADAFNREDSECEFIVKCKMEPEDLEKVNKKLQGQVYGYRAESKKLKEYLEAKGINPQDIINKKKEE